MSQHDQHARFDFHFVTAAESHVLAESLISEIRGRIQSAVNVDDQAAKPLVNKKYARFKRRRGLPDVRDWTLTGRTMADLSVLKADEHGFEIGFKNPVIQQRVAILQKMDQMFGLSPLDRLQLAELQKSLRAHR